MELAQGINVDLYPDVAAGSLSDALGKALAELGMSVYLSSISGPKGLRMAGIAFLDHRRAR